MSRRTRVAKGCSGRRAPPSRPAKRRSGYGSFGYMPRLSEQLPSLVYHPFAFEFKLTSTSGLIPIPSNRRPS